MSTVRFEKSGAIGVLKICRPEAMNALNKQVLSELRDMLGEISSMTDLRVLVLTGEGEKAFVAGADIKEMQAMTPTQSREMALSGQALMQKIEDMQFPVIGAVNGFALGGGLEIALACDFIMASNKARWGLPEVSLGLIPGYGGTQRLTRAIGRALAKRVALCGEMFSAQQAFEWGLFSSLHEPAELMPAVMKCAETLASRAPKSLSLVKEAIHRGGEGSLAQGLILEADLFARSFETKDHNEGIAAFIEKRAPQFQGK